MAWSSTSATEASLSTPLGDAGASAEREKSAPMMTAACPSPKSSARPRHSTPRHITRHKICSSYDVLGEVLTRQVSTPPFLPP